DDRNGGDDRLADLERELGQLPHTPRVLSGGGVHIYAQNPGLRMVRQIATGVEVRDQGYVVAPPSKHHSGRSYVWEIDPDEAPVAQLTLQWLERLGLKASDRGYRQAGPIPRGRRNDTLTKIAGAHRRSGSSSEAIEAALLVINRERCRPPLAASE